MSPNIREEELSNPAALRFMIAELERLDQQCSDYQALATNFHDQRVLLATMTEAAKPAKWNEILSAICLAIGSAGIGAAPNYFGLPGGVPTGIVVVFMSFVLLVGGIAPKVWK